jgi:hypothetical protein
VSRLWKYSLSTQSGSIGTSTHHRMSRTSCYLLSTPWWILNLDGTMKTKRSVLVVATKKRLAELDRLVLQDALVLWLKSQVQQGRVVSLVAESLWLVKARSQRLHSVVQPWEVRHPGPQRRQLPLFQRDRKRMLSLDIWLASTLTSLLESTPCLPCLLLMQQNKESMH